MLPEAPNLRSQNSLDLSSVSPTSQPFIGFFPAPCIGLLPAAASNELCAALPTSHSLRMESGCLVFACLSCCYWSLCQPILANQSIYQSPCRVRKCRRLLLISTESLTEAPHRHEASCPLVGLRFMAYVSLQTRYCHVVYRETYPVLD